MSYDVIDGWEDSLGVGGAGRTSLDGLHGVFHLEDVPVGAEGGLGCVC